MMNKTFFSIQLKIAAGLLVITLLFLLNAIIAYLFSQQVTDLLVKDYQANDRIAWKLSELRTMVLESKVYAGDWIFREKDTDSKLALRNIHSDNFPTLQIELKQISANLEKENQIEKSQQLDNVLRQVDTLFSIQKTLMQTLNTEADYEDPIKRFESETLLNTKIVPLLNDIVRRLDPIIAGERRARNNSFTTAIDYLRYERSFQVIAAMLVIMIAVLTWQFSARQITQNIQAIQQALSRLSIGEIPPLIADIANDELGEISVAVNQLIGGLGKLSDFAAQIGKGNYDASYEKLSHNDTLGNSLLNMRDNLKKVAEEDARRNWANEGAAKFADILRANSSSIPHLTKVVLSELVNYVGANQGSFFIVDQQSQEPQLQLMATFAWSRHRIRQKTVRWGEGLVGQAWIEKDILFLTEIPQQYIEIGSGLGDANPKNIVVVPLIFNDEVYGVIELASFDILPSYKIDFLRRISENIASTLAATFVNERTQRLLQESQSISEQLRVQEEEMRQNLEELLSTQEQSMRNMEIAKTSTQILEQIIESLPDGVIQVDAEWHIIKVNNNFCKMTGYSRETLLGSNIVRFAKQLNPAAVKFGVNYVQEITRKDRSVFMAQLTFHQLGEEERIVYIRDIDEQIKKEKEYIRLRKELERLQQTQR
ncbi:MAG: PAS domain S-box protein [Cytophagales bacterium]|nr:PAS domain S-box protein [Bernardetiaceae bacterium]MDW8204610.1 PAS domain S-box protein [Cytophagales bacterium]